MALYHELIHWCNATRPIHRVLLDACWHRIITGIVLPLLVLFVVLPWRIKKDKKLSPRMIWIDTFLLVILIFTPILNHFDPEEYATYFEASTLWQSGVAPLVTYCHPKTGYVKDANNQLYLGEEKGFFTSNEMKHFSYNLSHPNIENMIGSFVSAMPYLFVWFILRSIYFLIIKKYRHLGKDNIMWSILVLAIILGNPVVKFLHSYAENSIPKTRPVQMPYIFVSQSPTFASTSFFIIQTSEDKPRETNLGYVRMHKIEVHVLDASGPMDVTLKIKGKDLVQIYPVCTDDKIYYISKRFSGDIRYYRVSIPVEANTSFTISYSTKAIDSDCQGIVIFTNKNITRTYPVK